jgi:hypothetical protein
MHGRNAANFLTPAKAGVQGPPLQSLDPWLMRYTDAVTLAGDGTPRHFFFGLAPDLNARTPPLSMARCGNHTACRAGPIGISPSSR